VALAPQRSGPLYVGLQRPAPRHAEERLRAARARRGFLRWLGTLAVAFSCLVGTVAVTVARMEAGYRLDAVQKQLRAAQADQQRYTLELQRVESLARVAVSAEKLGMHPAPDYSTVPLVAVHDAPQLRSRTVVVTLPPPPRGARTGSLWARVRHWLSGFAPGARSPR
jgi:hypothetical protein